MKTVFYKLFIYVLTLKKLHIVLNYKRTTVSKLCEYHPHT